MDDKRIRPGVWLAVLGSLSALILVLSLLGGRAPSRTPNAPAMPDRPPSEIPAESAQRLRTSSRPGPRAPAAAEAPEYIEGLVYGEIDLREAKALMPDNLYWKLGAPTKDEDVLAARDEERRKRNEEYGKVLSGDAS